MISLTKSQTQIIEKLMKFEKENDEKGISTAFLGKQGINRRTFEINQDFLLQNYLIKITNTEKHGIQTWKYYKITPHGVIAYLKWCQLNQKQIHQKILQSYFPSIFEHFDALQKMYGTMFYYVFNQAINQFDLKPNLEVYDFSKKEIVKNPNRYNFRETIAVPHKTTRIIFARFLNFDLESVIVGRNANPDYFNDLEVEDNITNRITFLLFYDLIVLATLVDLLFQYFSWNMTVSKKKLFSGPEYEMDEKSMMELGKYYARICPIIISIINKDPKLKKLFQNTMHALSEEVKGLKLFEDLKKKFS
ncbi:MAG: hypothetical protein ACREAK_10355 [Nitrosarchaeum sp.]